MTEVLDHQRIEEIIHQNLEQLQQMFGEVDLELTEAFIDQINSIADIQRIAAASC